MTTTVAPADVMAAMDIELDLAPLARYAAESLRAGTPFAKVFMERLVEDSERYLERSVAAGMVHPAQDARRRAEFLTMFSIGLMILSPYLVPPGTPVDDFKEIQNRYIPEILELYTHGLFTDDTYLTAYRRARTTTPTAEGFTHDRCHQHVQGRQGLRTRPRHSPGST